MFAGMELGMWCTFRMMEHSGKWVGIWREVGKQMGGGVVVGGSGFQTKNMLFKRKKVWREVKLK